jgi:hypothetical protein
MYLTLWLVRALPPPMHLTVTYCLLISVGTPSPLPGLVHVRYEPLLAVPVPFSSPSHYQLTRFYLTSSVPPSPSAT